MNSCRIDFSSTVLRRREIWRWSHDVHKQIWRPLFWIFLQKFYRTSYHFSQRKVCPLSVGYVRRFGMLVKWNQCGRTAVSQVIGWLISGRWKFFDAHPCNARYGRSRKKDSSYLLHCPQLWKVAPIVADCEPHYNVYSFVLFHIELLPMGLISYLFRAHSHVAIFLGATGFSHIAWNVLYGCQW